MQIFKESPHSSSLFLWKLGCVHGIVEKPLTIKVLLRCRRYWILIFLVIKNLIKINSDLMVKKVYHFLFQNSFNITTHMFKHTYHISHLLRKGFSFFFFLFFFWSHGYLPNHNVHHHVFDIVGKPLMNRGALRWFCKV